MEEIIYNRCDGVISKLTKIAENKYIDKLGIVIDLDKCAILGKTSPNIIDLIEEDDYVNGKRVIYVASIEKYDEEELCVFVEETQDCIEARDIKTILTKEQYKANCYEVK